MVKNIWRVSILLPLVWAGFACSDSKFGGSSGTATNSTAASKDGKNPDGSSSNPDGTNAGVDGAATGSGGPGSEGSEGGNGSGPGGESSACIDGDKVNFNWTGPVKECIVDKGLSYNFKSKTCGKMPIAQFDCDWESVVAALKAKSEDLVTNVLSQAANDKVKLVSCGQSKDTNRIAAQWIVLPANGKVDCSHHEKSGEITTGCYELHEGAAPPPPKTQEEKDKQVYDCLNAL